MAARHERPAEAKQAFTVNNAVPNLILLDMQMRNLDGYQTARKLREFGDSGPIIALTADAMHGDMNGCIEAGCHGYLSKPFDAEMLVELVGKLTRKCNCPREARIYSKANSDINLDLRENQYWHRPTRRHSAWGGNPRSTLIDLSGQEADWIS